jgi:AcrR family transcriptional regulator
MICMPRPSRQLDQALLRSGRALYPLLGSGGLTQRRLAEHAGVQPGMFHYHFPSKDAFLAALLQQLYEEMFGRLGEAAAGDGPPLARLRRGLMAIGGFVREQHALLGRLAADALDGVAVVQAFIRDNAPRHLGLLLQLLDEAEARGEVRAEPPLQRLTFLMGATMAPMLVMRGAQALGLPIGRLADEQVLSEAALAARVDLALGALAPSKAAP